MKTSLASRGASWRRRLLFGILGTLTLTVAAEAATSLRTRSAASRSLLRHFAATPIVDTVRPSEQAFLETALDRSRREMRLAELALNQAANSDVRAFALQLSSEHRSLSESLEGLLRKKGVAVPATPEGPIENYQRLTEMTGADFDREFVNMMAKLHDELVTLFEQAIADAKDAEVREMVGRQLPILRDHRNRLAELKKVFE
jgi:putative membrane protein